MSDYSAIVFWSCIICVLYPYVVYPIAISAVAAVRPRRPRRSTGECPSISVIIAAYNEANNIGRRLDDLTDSIAKWPAATEIIVVSDGSTDATAATVIRYEARGVRLVEMVANQGKAVALNVGAEHARYDVLVLADARQTWSPCAIEQLVQNFSDPCVGAAGGELVLRCPNNALAGVGLYWRFEKWLRRKESEVHSTIGVTGAICAVRKSLFPVLPAGTILDDVYWPLTVALRGYRIVHEPRAHAFDQLPERSVDEFRRKVRTLSGNLQLVQRLPAVLRPWKNPLWIQFWSHKLMRLAVPWAMLILIVLGISEEGLLYRGSLCVQLSMLVLAVPSLLGIPLGRTRICSAPASFLLLNAAAWCAPWVWASGCTTRMWHKPRYA